MKKVIAVIDMRAFYSYVECIERGLDPYTTPLVVADKERGKNTIVLSVTPYLKSKGVPSRLRINDLPPKYNYIYATPRMALYMEKSALVISCFLDYFAREDIHIYSVDESFINIGPYLNYYKCDARELVRKVINHIKDKLGLEATAGIGDNMFLAKVALDVYAKKEKDGIATMYKEDIETKLWPITPLIKIWGIGPNYERRLNELGMYCVEDIAKANVSYLIHNLKSFGEELHRRCNGIDESDIREVYTPANISLSQGQTLFKDYTKDSIRLILKEVADELTFRMREKNLIGKTIHLFVGYSKDLGGFSAQTQIFTPSNMSDEILKGVYELLDKFCLDKPIRNVSISVSGLKNDDGYYQANIFEDYDERMKKVNLQKAIDKITTIFGRDSILRGSALLDESTIITRHNQIGGHRR